MEKDVKHTHTSWLTAALDWPNICIKWGEAGFAGDILNWRAARLRCVLCGKYRGQHSLWDPPPQRSVSGEFLLVFHLTPAPIDFPLSFPSVSAIPCNHPSPFSLCLFPSGFLPCTTLSVLFFTPLHATVRHQAENISNLGWGICLFTAVPRNSRAVGLTKAVINRQPGSELRATNREGPAGGGSVLQHTARIYRRTYQSSALREHRGREMKKDRAGVWEYTASPNWLLLPILGELNKLLHAALRFD